MRTVTMIMAAAGVVWAAAVAGQLDDDFGTGGEVITEASGHLFAVAFDSTGDLIAVGIDEDVGDAWVVRRYAADGTLEDTFGATPGDSDDTVFDVAIDGSDRVVVVGEATVTTTGGRGKKKKTVTVRKLAVARFLANGSLDATFGDAGVASADLTFGGQVRIAIQPDGKILVATHRSVTTGKGRNRSISEAFVLVRFESDGDLDTAFGNDGVVVDDATSGHESPAGVDLQSDGKIIVASFAGSGHVVRRYNSDGTIDTGFGSGGLVTGASGDTIRALTIDADDRIVLAGYRHAGSGSEGLVIRLTADGSSDTAFGTSGVWVSGSTTDEELVGVAMDGTNIVLGSLLIDGQTLDVTTYRLDDNGDLDTSFGTGGVGEVSSPGDNSQDGVRDMAVDANGNIALGGENPGTGSASDWYVIRYCGG